MKVTHVTEENKRPTTGKEHIPSSNCCGRCMYNIPQGTLLLLLPGMILLLIGVVVTVFDIEQDSEWQAAFINIGFIFLVLGFIMTAVVLGFCIASWNRRRPKRAAPSSGNTSSGTAETGVTLVGVYRISSPEHVVYTVSQDVPHTSIT